MRKIRGVSFAILTEDGTVLVAGPCGQYVLPDLTGIAHTVQMDMSDGSLLVYPCHRAGSGTTDHVLTGQEIRVDLRASFQ